jgi:two-component system, NtrC family, nitrogen regulation response regulator GlnG
MQVFISYSSHDKDFASRLCNDLTLYDVEVWFDDWSIRPGDSIPKAIQNGLRSSDFVLLLISRSGVQSNWVEEELNSSLFSAVSAGKPSLLPLLLEKCDMPTLLQHRKYVDFTRSKDYENSLNQLITRLYSETTNSSPPKPIIPGFRDLKLLGEGAFSTVYKALEARTSAIKAIKFPKSRRRLEPELAVTQALGAHPGIVPIEGTVPYKDRLLLVMPYAGHSLKWFIEHKKIQPQQIDKIVSWMMKLFEVLAFSHSKRIVHRDIKPSNILIDEFGDLRVVDFGIAQRIQYAEFQHSTVVRGTLCYMSPEQQLGYQATEKSDIYSVGALCYELVTGEKPVGRFRNPRDYNPRISVELDAIINKCLEREPDERYQSASEAYHSLGELGKSSPIRSIGTKIIGESAAIKHVIRSAQQAAQSSEPVLIVGETGTGKELVARLIYEHYSGRVGSDSPFVPVNVAAMPEVLVESELFGYIKGSFTGAASDQKGLFSEAEGGVLFLDEIESLSLAAQVKILRAISEGEFRPIGSTKTHRMNVKVISATNHSMEQLVVDGRFRRDLFHRLNAFQIVIPPLRDRKEDIPRLVKYFAKRLLPPNAKLLRFSDASIKLLSDYSWQGNVRELENFVHRLLVTHNPSKIVEPSVVETLLNKLPRRSLQLSSLAEARLQAEKNAISAALEFTNSNFAEAAEILQISKSLLKRLCTKHGLGEQPR